jgi:predicted nucleotidyltransferase
MNNTSESYKQLGIPFFKEVFNLLDRTFKEMDIPYYLLGATAISLELLKDGIKPPRGTKDIDFAIMISSKAEYEQFSAELQKKRFVKVAAPWTFRHPGYDIVVDILPFGKIEENYQSTIAKEWAVKLDQSLEYTLSILDGFLTGIKEKL